jgi:hypothetical protein
MGELPPLEIELPRFELRARPAVNGRLFPFAQNAEEGCGGPLGDVFLDEEIVRVTRAA